MKHMETTGKIAQAGKSTKPASRIACLSCGHSRESFLYSKGQSNQRVCCFNTHAMCSQQMRKDWSGAYTLVATTGVIVLGVCAGIAELMLGMGVR